MRSIKILPVLPAAVAAIALAGCGDDTQTADTGARAGNPVDRAFIADMVPHHRSAVQMAKIAQKRGQSAFVQQLANDVVRTQTQEIDVMRSEDHKLAGAGIAKGSLAVAEHTMGMNGDVASLKTAKPFDRAFIAMMIPHHEGAVVMAKAELAKGKDPKLKTLAQNIITAQQREIATMRKHQGAGSTMSDHMSSEQGH
jgi:uncharacterized protein (DUF305 family)